MHSELDIANELRREHNWLESIQHYQRVPKKLAASPLEKQKAHYMLAYLHLEIIQQQDTEQDSWCYDIRQKYTDHEQSVAYHLSQLDDDFRPELYDLPTLNLDLQPFNTNFCKDITNSPSNFMPWVKQCVSQLGNVYKKLVDIKMVER